MDPRSSASRSPRACSSRTPRPPRATLAALKALGVQDRGRRLRHRLLVARVPAPLPGRLREDRPLVRPRHPALHPRTSRSSNAVIELGHALGLSVDRRGRRDRPSSSATCRPPAATPPRASSSAAPSTRTSSSGCCSRPPRDGCCSPLACRANARASRRRNGASRSTSTTSGHGYSLGERLRAHDLDDDARDRLGGSVIVTRDGPRLYLYTTSEAAAREAERVLRELVDADRLTADISVTRWDEERDAWLDAEGRRRGRGPARRRGGPRVLRARRGRRPGLPRAAGRDGCRGGTADRAAPRHTCWSARSTTRRCRSWPSAYEAGGRRRTPACRCAPTSSPSCRAPGSYWFERHMPGM